MVLNIGRHLKTNQSPGPWGTRPSRLCTHEGCTSAQTQWLHSLCMECIYDMKLTAVRWAHIINMHWDKPESESLNCRRYCWWSLLLKIHCTVTIEMPPSCQPRPDRMSLARCTGSRVKPCSPLMTYKKPAPLHFQTFEKRYQAMCQITKSSSFTAEGQKLQAPANPFGQ